MKKNDKFNALVRRISSLPFVKPVDLDKAFAIFNSRAESLKDGPLRTFSIELIEYAQTQWREQFAIQDWKLYDISCLLVPSTNNGNEGNNGRFLSDFGVHPPYWSFILDATSELEKAESDIPSILYSSIVPANSSLYNALKEDRERIKANYEAGLIDLDGMMGKMGAISLATGKSKFCTDDADAEREKGDPIRRNNGLNKDPPRKRRG